MNKVTREKISRVGMLVVDPNVMSAAERGVFSRRKLAIEMKLDGYTGADIRKATDISESELCRLFKRYTTINADGIFWGEAALTPNFRIAPYRRKRPPDRKHTEAKGGLAGVLSYTLEQRPEIRRRFEIEVFRTHQKHAHGRRLDKKNLCLIFYDICESEGVLAHEWPFNQPRGARRTISSLIDNILADDFKKAALVSGGRIAQTHSKVGTGYPSFLNEHDVYDLIEIDSYHEDAFFTLRITGDKRIKTEDVISRFWLIAAVCKRSNAILAMKFVFSSEINSQDVVDLISEAFDGNWQPRSSFNVPGLSYCQDAGMPCYSVPELRHHTWGGICLDNAMQHHADKVYDLAIYQLGIALNYGPLGQPARRSKVEGLFKRIASRVMHQSYSTTGSSPERGRVEAPEKAAIYYQIDVDDALEVMDVYAANYNATPQGGLNKVNSPLEVLRAYYADKSIYYTATPDVYLNGIQIGSHKKIVKVTGSIMRGIRPRVKLDQAIYTSPDLANSPHLIGQRLAITVNPHDYRYIEAFLSNGVYFGTLTVEAAWRAIPHSVLTRRLINRAYSKREFSIMEGEHPVLAWQKHLQANANPQNARELKRLNDDAGALDRLLPEEHENPVASETVILIERWKNLEILK